MQTEGGAGSWRGNRSTASAPHRQPAQSRPGAAARGRSWHHGRPSGPSIVLPCFNEEPNVRREAVRQARRGRGPVQRAARGDRRRRRQLRRTAASRGELARSDRRVRSCSTRTIAATAQPAVGHRGRPHALGAADRRRPPVRPPGARGVLPFADSSDLIVG